MIKFRHLTNVIRFETRVLIKFYPPVYTHLTLNQFFYRTNLMRSTEDQGGDAGLSLQEWLNATETSYSAFSRMLPCSVGYPRQLALGLARPSYELACRIEQVTEGSVPRTRWYPPAEKTIEDEQKPDLEDLL